MNSIQNNNIGLELYIFRLLFQVLRPIRIKYNLSINLILSLNSCYLYSKLVKDQFYMTDIYKFNSYYSTKVMKRYVDILALRGFLIPDKPGTFHTLYKLSESAITLIQEIDQYYSKEMYEFSNRYHLDL